ncbi:thiosulfate sulfurtransferase 18 [Striga asiatica]|uniref:Thiosulfate sulfurtransferase 18 n=1 Tax=Striga asiatica TaxID=4170 RepID=A0A5A7PQE8_STRAF|nr:thiosulfate sulfurtransferase 18 [Striga asiatica]
MDQIKESYGEKVKTVDVDEAKHLLSQGYRCLDVRTEEEFKEGHLENSLNIPYMFCTPEGRVKNPRFLVQVLVLYGKEDHVVLVCRSGARSESAAIDLLNADFKHVYNMGGGYIAWVGKGCPVKKPHHAEL